MPRKKSNAPGFRYHVSGQAVATFCGQNFYLGPHDSPASWAKYHALCAEYNANGRTKPPAVETHQAEQPITVRCVTGEFREHIKIKYSTNPQEANRFESLCTTLEDEYGDDPATEFGPRKLAEIRDLFVAGGNCRKYTNRQTRNVIQIFRHAVSRGLIPPDRIVALEALRYGQTKAAESVPVEAVDIEAVRLTARHLSPTQKALVRIQAATGMLSDDQVMHCDIFATLLDAAKIPVPEMNGKYPVRGMSLMPHMLSAGKETIPQRTMIFELWGNKRPIVSVPLLPLAFAPNARQTSRTRPLFTTHDEKPVPAYFELNGIC